MKNRLVLDVVESKLNAFVPGVSVNCVIFGFYSKALKVLLNRFTESGKWMLPNSFIRKEEDVDDCASRILQFRTGLRSAYLKQFHSFGAKDRIDIEENQRLLKHHNIDPESGKWYLQRFIGLGYYAFIRFRDAELSCLNDEESAWFNVDDVPSLYGDHNHILDTAIKTIRKDIGYVPMGYELLPEKFTIPELRSIYETVLGRKIDRRNFQRKMLSIGIIKPLNETRKEGAHKSPNLYAFNKIKYDEAEKYGTQFMTNNL